MLTWDGERNQEIRLRFVIDNGTPTIAELAARKKGSAWGTLATNATPEFRVVSGLRRMDREAEEGLEENGVKEITSEVFEKYQWDPFWDAPLNVPGGMPDDRRTIGLPRKADEIHRATATYKADSCDVKSDKTHLTVTFPGVSLGVFAGQLQFAVVQRQQPDSAGSRGEHRPEFGGLQASGAMASAPIVRSSRRPRRPASARAVSRSRSMRRGRSGCALRRGTSRATAR